MEKQFSDKEIMAELLDSLEMKVSAFARKLDGVHRVTIYNVLTDVHGISDTLENKIIQAFPNVNPAFIKNGVFPILINDRLKPTVKPFVEVQENPVITERLARIEDTQIRMERKLDEILTRLSIFK